jgi:transcriptional regulator with XRE-family HTH domain
MKTYRSELKRLREEQGLSITECAQRAGFPKGTVWRAEHPTERQVRGSTLHRIMAQGLGLKRDGDDYQAILELWANERVEQPENKSPGVAKVEEVAALARGLGPADLDGLLFVMRDHDLLKLVLGMASRVISRPPE